jgi:hypothetical protein
VTMVGVWLALVFGLTRIKANLHRQ